MRHRELRSVRFLNCSSREVLEIGDNRRVHQSEFALTLIGLKIAPRAAGRVVSHWKHNLQQHVKRKHLVHHLAEAVLSPSIARL